MCKSTSSGCLTLPSAAMDTESKEDGGAGFPEVTDSVVEHIRSAITVVPDFPKPGGEVSAWLLLCVDTRTE